ncbi:MAG: dephospho-CoA kinase [Flavobacteriales bacterium]|nr:dephospho-CoA kinase [Flavobacteriales bacterium]
MLKIGLTGGIGSGKSTVIRIFELLGVPVYEADKAGKWLLHHDVEVVSKVKSLFSDSIYDANGQLDSAKVSSLVFNEPKLLSELNTIVHPAVGRHFEEWVGDQKESKYIVKEAAILFESGSYTSLDRVIVVSAPEKVRLERVIARDQSKKEQVQQRMNNQWSEQQRLAKSDYIIVNDGASALIPQVIALHNELTK